MKTLARISFLAALAVLSSCAVTSRDYVEELTGYATTEGRITRIESLNSKKVEPLKDGIAVTVGQPGCRVLIRFENGEEKVFDVYEDVILVHGYDCDFILRSEFAEPHR